MIRDILVKILKCRPVDLTRENLGLVPGWKDLYIENDSNEYYKSAVSVLESDCFNKELGRLIQQQVEFIAQECPNEQSALIARGTINGLFLIKDRLETMKSIAEDRQQKVEEFNEFKTMPDIQ